MNEPTSSRGAVSDPSLHEAVSALFADLVVRQTQMALLLMGRVPHPESGKPRCDLEQARLAIDQLEMLELKTKGNLTKEEDGLLKQSLMTLRMAFVEAVEESPNGSKDVAARTPSSADASQAAGEKAGPAPAPEPQNQEESKKKFTKKY
jgi:hypothetical protein